MTLHRLDWVNAGFDSTAFAQAAELLEKVRLYMQDPKAHALQRPGIYLYGGVGCGGDQAAPIRTSDLCMFW